MCECAIVGISREMKLDFSQGHNEERTAEKQIKFSKSLQILFSQL